LLVSTWDENNYMHFFQPQLICFINKVDIMFTKDGIRTLTNVIITNQTQADLLPWTCATQGLAASNVIQTKEKNYRNWHPTNQLLPLAIEVFGCLHKDVDVFLHDYANAI